VAPSPRPRDTRRPSRNPTRRAEDPTREGTIITHLEHLQQNAPGASLGTVTQFEVLLRDAATSGDVSRKIDEVFSTSEAPTGTRSRAAFLEGATFELREVVRFGRAFGIVCVVALLVLLGNTMLMAVHERRAELGVLLTLGYRKRHLFQLVMAETLTLTLGGSAAGIAAALLLIGTLAPGIGVEGVSVAFAADGRVLLAGIGAAAATGVLAGLAPAIGAARVRLVEVLKGG